MTYIYVPYMLNDIRVSPLKIEASFLVVPSVRMISSCLATNCIAGWSSL